MVLRSVVWLDLCFIELLIWWKDINELDCSVMWGKGCNIRGCSNGAGGVRWRLGLGGGGFK